MTSAAVGTWEEVVATIDPTVRSLAEAARALIREVDPAVVEVPWPRQRTIGYGIGARKMSEHYCYLAIHPRHVNLGFNHGASLPDPNGLLGGPGALLRHTKITSVNDLRRPGLRELLAEARRERERALVPA